MKPRRMVYSILLIRLNRCQGENFSFLKYERRVDYPHPFYKQNFPIVSLREANVYGSPSKILYVL